MNDDMKFRRVIVPSLPSPMTSHHPHCVIAKGIIFVSGLVSELRPDGLRIGVQESGSTKVHDFRSQIKSIFCQLDLILDHADSDKSLVVDVQVFLLNLHQNFSVMNEEYGQYFGSAVPARTTVEVVRFPSDVVVELKVIALTRGTIGV